MPKIRTDIVSKSINSTIDITSRITNDSSPTNDLGSNLSNVPSSSNSLADCSNHPIRFLNHNLFSVDQFCDADLELAFRKSTCFVRDLQGNDQLTAKRSRFKTKIVPSSKGRLNLLHIDLCGPMRIESINGKIYIMVIVDDYSRYTWTHFLISKDETPEVLKDFLKMIQQNLQAQSFVRRILHCRKFECAKSSALSDNSQQQDTKPTLNIPPIIEPITPTTNVYVEENNTDQAKYARFQPYEFINPLCTPVQEVPESSSRNFDTSNMHTFYQRHRSNYHWNKDHPLEQVGGNPSKPVQTRRQLSTYPEMCMFALTVSTAKLINFKEAMADHA
ncbi:retrovirus-related pol polyprotein from transposon TNT 1-94 [Tanacetum coccineum]|uniref:Retrovirus-related pol polyprotein from transposon TNT 1-94 n=1 Tax=Tanacetum coccineum TaxID=301880 RepID=A0ABQ5DKA9_9ASTR